MYFIIILQNTLIHLIDDIDDINNGKFDRFGFFVWFLLYLCKVDKGFTNRKIEAYTISLESIVNTEKGKRSDKAPLLLDNYRKASIFFFLLEASRNKWRCKVLRESL
jgi:hypothetical protein